MVYFVLLDKKIKLFLLKNLIFYLKGFGQKFYFGFFRNRNQNFSEVSAKTETETWFQYTSNIHKLTDLQKHTALVYRIILNVRKY